MLYFGAVGDRYGRKLVLIAGMSASHSLTGSVPHAEDTAPAAEPPPEVRPTLAS